MSWYIAEHEIWELQIMTSIFYVKLTELVNKLIILLPIKEFVHLLYIAEHEL